MTTFTSTAGNDNFTGTAGFIDRYVSNTSSASAIFYFINSTQLQVQTSGEGTDLLAHIEELQFSDALLTATPGGAITLTGDASANTLRLHASSAATAIYGGGGNDTLTGGNNNDTLDGGTGDDLLTGGLGSDTYFVDSSGDVIVELAALGTDSVQASVSYTLVAELENLFLIGSAAINGTGNAQTNVISGNSADNILSGGDGNDILSDAGGNDVLNGDAGDDNLSGGAGNDVLTGGLGNDTYVVADGGDSVIEAAGEGTDFVQSAVNYSLGENLENLTLTGAATHGTGNAQVNTITGNTLDNMLDGGLGQDTLVGGAGNDTYIVELTSEAPAESAGQGTDQVWSAVSYTLGTNLEDLLLQGSSHIDGTGNTLHNLLVGNNGDNELIGDAGNDTLRGGEGNDILRGGLGNDTYTEDGADLIVEYAGEGIDTVLVSDSYTLGDRNLENIVLGGSAAASLIGNSNSNHISGNGADNTLNGGQGADTLVGGLGDDLYIVDNAGDVVTEAAGAGTDGIISSQSLSLAAAVENLFLTGSANISATGNSLGNQIVGNNGHNDLNGAGGADLLIGGLGNDSYRVDGADSVVEEDGQGIDTVFSRTSWALDAAVENLVLDGTGNINGSGNAQANQLTGNIGNNTLNGLGGADLMNGGDGNDIYIVDDIADVAVDSGTGLDLVRSSVTHTLGSGIENLLLTGNLAIDGNGNGLANVITGNNAANRLDGGSGIDRLLGGGGNDTLVSSLGEADILTGGSGDDSYLVQQDFADLIEQAGGGIDTVVATLATGNAYTLGNHLENLLLVGSDVDGHGNTLANAITGTAGSNLLDGGAAADLLSGLAGDDAYIIDHAGDQAIEAAAEGYDRAFSAVTWALSANLEQLTLTGSSAIDGTGNELDNRLIGNTAANRLEGGLGNDLLNGSGGADILVGGEGDDQLITGAGNETLNGGLGIDLANYFGAAAGVTINLALGSAQATGGSGSDTLLEIENVSGSDNGDDVLTGSTAANDLSGHGGNDTLNGGAGNDRLYGGEGNDTLLALAGDDWVDGGNGIDHANYSGASGDVTIDLNIVGVQNTGAAGNDTLLGIEDLTGSNTGNDTLVGDDTDNLLSGGGGNDSLDGGAGLNNLQGGAGNDSFLAHAGDDLIDGGNGTDLVSYAGAGQGVRVNLGISGAQFTGGGGIDSLVAIENLTGSAGNDTLTGRTDANLISGLGGNDVLAGGLGNDTLSGGAGIDFFLFDTTLNKTTNVDLITDFSAVDDRFNLDDAIFSNAGAPGQLAAGAFRSGSAAVDADDRLIHDQSNGRVYYDADGNGAGLSVQFATISAGTVLTAADFWLV
ncbi:MAG TPA: hypothetical protein VLI06_11880 [Solimonas sp.]|nr:hypothetical protein [Solimonas sp.]